MSAEGYEKRLIRADNVINSEGRLTNNNYMKFELARIRHDTKLYSKLTMPHIAGRADSPRMITGHVIYKNRHMFVLEGPHYCEAYTWWDLLTARKFKGNKEGTNE